MPGTRPLAFVWFMSCTPPATQDAPDGTPPRPPQTEVPPPSEASIGLDAILASTDGQFGTIVRVAWAQIGTGTIRVEYSFETDVWLSTPERLLGDGTHEEVLLGLPYDTEVLWRLVAEDAAGTTVTPVVANTTAPAPLGLPVATVTVSDPAKWDATGAPYLFTTLAQPEAFGQPWWIVIVDRQGRVVWSARSQDQRVSMHSRVARDGRTLFIDQNSYWAIFDRGAHSQVVQLTLDGAVQHVFDAPGLHHPFTDLPDGSIAYGAAVGIYETEQLAIVHPDGSTDLLFDCEQWLDSMAVWDFCSSNALTYDELSNTYLYTFWSFESVVQIDGETGAPIRWFGHIPGSWSFDPMSSVFWNPHGAVLTTDGTLLLSSDLTTNGVETVVREYHIDETFDTLQQVWKFGVGDGLYGIDMGEAVRLPNGNTWHSYGDLPRLREATPAGEVVWDIKWPSAAIGHSSPIANLYDLLAPRP